ncbi:MAG TPA: hypothetical protein PLZ21_13365, partial [Armatimonadota bacterium]|nr:hypothetical protein [Armatimonadota bacterium]
SGLLVKLWGMVISKGAGWFVLEDGSGAAIKVYSTAAVSQGSFVSLKGIISRDSSGVILYMTEPAVE